MRVSKITRLVWNDKSKPPEEIEEIKIMLGIKESVNYKLLKQKISEIQKE